MVLSVSGSITLIRDAKLVASSDVVSRDRCSTETVRSLNDGCSETHLNVPLNVAVEEINTWVGGLESQNSIRVGHDVNCVTHRRVRVDIRIWTRPLSRIGVRSVKHLEMVAVKMERVHSTVNVIDNNINNVTIFDDERMDSAIHNWVGVVCASCCCSVKGRYLLVNIRRAVDARSAQNSCKFVAYLIGW
jgi:hypothetical protein